MSAPAVERARRDQERGAKQAAKVKEETRPAGAVRAKPSLPGNRAIAEVAKTAQPTSPHTDWLRGRIVFSLNQGPKGFAVDRWKLALESPADGLTADEQAALDGVVNQAVFESESKYRHYFAGSIEARQIELPLSMPFQDLATERSRSLAAFHVGDGLRALVEATRGAEQARERSKAERTLYPPRPGLTVDQELAREETNLREEIARMRSEMKAGLAEQSAVKSKLAQFAAFVAVSPEPDLGGWNNAEQYLRMAEASLVDRDPRGANGFMDVARVALKSQQDWWNRYKHDYAFGDEVIAPVFWQAFSLLSIGIVDKELFDTFEHAASKGPGEQLLIIVQTLVDRIGNVVTFGGHEGWKKGVEKQIKQHPDDPLWQAMLLATPDALKAVFDAIVPLQEVETMAGIPPEGSTRKPDFWQRVGAFFSALLKVAMLIEMAGKAKGRGKRTGAPEGYGERGEAAKQETTPREQQTAKQPPTETGERYGQREGYRERGEAAKKETAQGPKDAKPAATESGERYGHPEGYGEMGEAGKRETAPSPPAGELPGVPEGYGEMGEAAKRETTPEPAAPKTGPREFEPSELGEGKAADRLATPETPAKPVKEPPPKTAAGVSKERSARPKLELAPLEPGSPRALHEQWAKEVSEQGLGPREEPRPSQGQEARRGTYETLAGKKRTFSTPQEALAAYDEALARAGGREVGIFRNADSPTPEYVVRVGDQASVSPPLEGNWDAVLHRHPNPENILTRRRPAPQDVQGTQYSAWRSKRPVTEFIDYPLPDGRRALVSYTVDPQSGTVTIRWERLETVPQEGGGVTEKRIPVEEQFPSLEAYAESYGERKTGLDPTSADYQWIMRDLDAFYRAQKKHGQSAAGTLTPPEKPSVAAKPKPGGALPEQGAAPPKAPKPKRQKKTAEQKREEHVARELNPKKNKRLPKDPDPMELEPEPREPTADELLDDPELAEILDEAEEGGGTRRRGEAAATGSADEAAMVREWRGELKQGGYDKLYTAKGKFKGSKALEKVFTDVERRPSEPRRRHGGPDLVAVDTPNKRVLVGDVTSEFGNLIEEEFGSGERLHIEKTLEDARRVADMPEFADYEVVAQERYWRGEHAGKTTKAIVIRRRPKPEGKALR